VLVRDLLRLIPFDTKSVVTDTVRKYSATVRELVRSETRLVMQWGNKDEDTYMQCQSPVSVDEIGYPEGIARVEIPEKYSLAAKLAIWKPALKNLHTSAGEVLQLISSLEHELNPILDVDESKDALGISSRTAETLLEIANLDNFDLVKFIHEVNEDILGVYRYDGSEEPDYPKDFYRSNIFIYWGVIGLCSRSMDVSIEGLTVTVLAHELGHAYTHLGFDRDGKRWSGFEFSRSDHELKEGLAQYYTARVLKRMGLKMPLALEAYETLLPRQSPAYQSHQPWLDSATPEAVGAALSVIRHQGSGRYRDFDEEVRKAKRRLRGDSQI
jgi:hypothetical protein